MNDIDILYLYFDVLLTLKTLNAERKYYLLFCLCSEIIHHEWHGSFGSDLGKYNHNCKSYIGKPNYF